MHMIGRSGLLVFAFLWSAGLCGCSTAISVASGVTSTVGHVASAIVHPFSRAKSTPPPAGLDDYKTQVAQHVASHNPEHQYSGTLPAMLPAIVVLEITVDQDGRMTEVAVQRARDAHAAQVALASMRRSEPLPPPQRVTLSSGSLKFSETFLFADAERYQLRSLAGGQAGE
jgi:protein TonB